jgi:predicted small lipoprotein YifL
MAEPRTRRARLADEERGEEMRKMIGTFALLLGAASLSACGAKKDPNMPTDEENRQLDNAAEMLDASPDSLAVNEDVALGNGEDDGADDGEDDAADNSAGNR